MPQNKSESLIYTVLMCAFMVFFMSIYNIALGKGLSWNTIQEAWLGFPIAYVVGMICDWFLVSRPAKKIAFRIVKQGSKKLTLIIPTCMVCGMVILMSLFGAIEMVGLSSLTVFTWMTNIPKNLLVALPMQLIVAGPFVRLIFRKAFPEGTIVVKNPAM